jgi:hypothetical protein
MRHLDIAKQDMIDAMVRVCSLHEARRRVETCWKSCWKLIFDVES